MNPEIKQLEKEQYELWRKFNYWQSICAGKKSTQKDYAVRAKVLDNWQATCDKLSRLRSEE